MTTATAIEIGPRSVPKRTLGWEVLGWTHEYLLQPDGPEAGQPWNFTNEQVRFILNWYAIDADGRFVYRYGMLRRMKAASRSVGDSAPDTIALRTKRTQYSPGRIAMVRSASALLPTKRLIPPFVAMGTNAPETK